MQVVSFRKTNRHIDQIAASFNKCLTKRLPFNLVESNHTHRSLPPPTTDCLLAGFRSASALCLPPSPRIYLDIISTSIIASLFHGAIFDTPCNFWVILPALSRASILVRSHFKKVFTTQAVVWIQFAVAAIETRDTCLS